MLHNRGEEMNDLEQILINQLGGLTLANAKLSAQVIDLNHRLDELRKANEKPAEDAPIV